MLSKQGAEVCGTAVLFWARRKHGSAATYGKRVFYLRDIAAATNAFPRAGSTSVLKGCETTEVTESAELQTASQGQQWSRC